MQQGWLTRAVVILAMIGLLGFSPIPGFAQDAGPDFSNPPAADRHGPRPGGFEKDDVNKDGQVTRAEFSGPKEMFSTWMPTATALLPVRKSSRENRRRGSRICPSRRQTEAC
ncbi:hypothetical protein [Desulfosarcina cetonica]|uniref:hypothetical protein n=1 Tax=Desulfosarcina cetonica TaxID=90730 RepID=UPI0006D0A797|nr:hypothetical protein [Desulfosarcina cetonica]